MPEKTLYSKKKSFQNHCHIGNRVVSTDKSSRTAKHTREERSIKLTGDLKKKVEAAASRGEAKKTIEEAGMLLTDDELDQVVGGVDDCDDATLKFLALATVSLVAYPGSNEILDNIPAGKVFNGIITDDRAWVYVSLQGNPNLYLGSPGGYVKISSDFVRV